MTRNEKRRPLPTDGAHNLDLNQWPAVPSSQKGATAMKNLTGIDPFDALDRIFARTVRVDGSCWYWYGAKTRGGYSALSYQGRVVYGHRLAYAAVHGAIPEGLELDHLCMNKGCVNPYHLEAVTHRVNCQRAYAARRAAA